MANATTLTLPELRDNNPYFTGSVSLFTDGTYTMDAGDFNYLKSDKDRYYTTQDNENLSAIAFQAYGDSKLWWIIAKANNVFDPFTLDAGTTLLIPSLNHIQIANS